MVDWRPPHHGEFKRVILWRNVRRDLLRLACALAGCALLGAVGWLVTR